MTTEELTEDQKQHCERERRVRRFSDTEMSRRIEELRREMSAHNLDAMVFTDEVNVVYATGMLVPSFATRTRPIIVVLPLTGEPVLVCSRSQSANARSASAVATIAPFERFEDDAIDVVAGILNDVVPRGGRVGCETGKEQRLGLSIHGFHALANSVLERHLVDGSPALWPVRLIKSAEEIAYMKTAGAMNDVAMTEAIAKTRRGVTEQMVRDAWALELARHGADKPGYLAIHSGPDNYRRISSVATNRVLEDGDLLWMDGGPVFRGYWSDVTRMVSVGPARQADKSRYSFAWEAVNTLVDAVKPGLTAGDIARMSAAIFSRIGRPMGGASRIGHGIGLELTEPPSIVDGDETVLRPGMTISIETGLADWDGYFLMETNLVVTESGRDLLSPPAPQSLPEAL